jgi:hypothetical protein
MTLFISLPLEIINYIDSSIIYKSITVCDRSNYKFYNSTRYWISFIYNIVTYTIVLYTIIIITKISLYVPITSLEYKINDPFIVVSISSQQQQHVQLQQQQSNKHNRIKIIFYPFSIIAILYCCTQYCIEYTITSYCINLYVVPSCCH